MLRQAEPATAHRDPADWEFHVRRADGTWLTRPAPRPDAPADANALPWTRRLTDSWNFDSAADARRAAIAHGADPDAFTVIPAPRRPGEWLAAGRPQVTTA